jgi:hypothetical protein
MLRTAGLLFVLAAGLVAGCSIDGIEWESTGFVPEEVERRLVEEHHVEEPTVECIKREVGGAVWECRAQAGTRHFECEVKAGPREVIHEVECEEEHEEGAEQSDEPSEHGEEPVETTDQGTEPTDTTDHGEEPAETTEH